MIRIDCGALAIINELITLQSAGWVVAGSGERCHILLVGQNVWWPRVRTQFCSLCFILSSVVYRTTDGRPAAVWGKDTSDCLLFEILQATSFKCFLSDFSNISRVGIF